MTIRAVVFDWAGTMVDFGSVAPVVAMQQAFAAEGIPIEIDEVRADMGRAKRDHVRAILNAPRVRDTWSCSKGVAPSEADVQRIHDAVLPYMQEAGVARATLIPGALETVHALRARQILIGSTTGYTRDMMTPILAAAAAQGYAPDSVVCAGETKAGRPSPLMLWKTMVELGVYPAQDVIKIDDAPVGIAEGKAAGCFTIGVAATGNETGLDHDAFSALSDQERAQRVGRAAAALRGAGADMVIDSVADLIPALQSLGRLEQGQLRASDH
jgi:phosphonoacetaldehyde hydrolase